MSVRLLGGFRVAVGRRVIEENAWRRAMRATFDWRFELLSGYKRTLFRRLSVFSGGFTLGAAEAAKLNRELVGQPIPGKSATHGWVQRSTSYLPLRDGVN